MEQQKKDIIDAIKNNNLYNYIASNYWKLDNAVLVDLLKECIWIITEEQQREDLIYGLKDVCEWED